MLQLNQQYWEDRYQNGTTGWDVGEISTPLKAYIDQLTDKSLKILIPGAGFGHEAAYLHQQGFTDVNVLDLSKSALNYFRQKNPTFPTDHLVLENYFDHMGQYDLMLEQTFFCAIDRELRQAYVLHTHQLLKPGGKLVGLLWSGAMNETQPPYGGDAAEYQSLFSPYFDLKVMAPAYNSIKPRAGTELFIHFIKK